MAKEVMERKAADNEYLHKDFHGALSNGIDYLDQKFGEDAVRDYLRQFANAFYSPLKDKIRSEGLAPLRDHIQEVYRIEGGEVSITFSEDEMIVKVAACPAVSHMRA